MKFTAEIIASFIEGEVKGDNNIVVNNIAKIEEGKEGDLSFLSNLKYEQHIYTTKSSIVIVSKDFYPKENISATIIKVDDPYKSFADILKLYIANKPQPEGISERCSIASSAILGIDCYVGDFSVIEKNVTIGENCKIYPQVYVGCNVKIGDNVTLHPGVKIHEDTVLGNNIIIHSGAVIGGDGFGFAPIGDSYQKIPQIGNVVIEDDVEIGANTTIDRSTMGSTIIRRGVKLDNLIQIGHNVEIGANTVAAAQLGIAGSSKVGANCILGGQVGIAGHLTIADRTTIASKSGIFGTLKNSGTTIMGIPAIDRNKNMRILATQKSLPEMKLKIRDLEKEIIRLKEKIGDIE